jgi:hypothetical protein
MARTYEPEALARRVLVLVVCGISLQIAVIAVLVLL